MILTKSQLLNPKSQDPKNRFLLFLKILIFLSPLPFGCVGKIWSPLFYVMLLILTYLGLRVIEKEQAQLKTQNPTLKTGDSGFKVEKLEDRSQESGERKFEARNSKFETSMNDQNRIQDLEARRQNTGERKTDIKTNISIQNSKFKTQNLNMKKILYEKWIKILFVAFLIFIGLQIVPLPIALVKIISPKKIQILNQLLDELPAFTSLSLVTFETLVYGLIVWLYGLFFWVMNRIQFQKREMVSLLNTLVLVACIQVVFGLFKYAQGNTHFFLFFYPMEKSDISRFLTGTLGNANHFAFFLEMVLPLVLSLFFYRLRFFQTDISWKQKILSIADENKIILIYFISIALMGSGIFLTGSRAGIVTMIFLLILFTQLSIYLKLSRGIRRKIIWILAAIFLLMLYVGIQDTIGEFKSSPIAEGGRFTRWPNTFKMFQDYPVIGTGFATYRYSYFLYDEGVGKWSTHAHNDLLEVLAEGGVVGGLLFYILIGLIIFSIIRKWTRRHNPDIRILGLGIIVSVFAVLFHSFFDFSLRNPANMFVFVLVLALGLKIVNYKRSTS